MKDVDADCVGVAVGDWDSVDAAEGVTLWVTDGVCERVGLSVELGVSVPVNDAVSVAVWLGLCVDVPVAVPVAV